MIRGCFHKLHVVVPLRSGNADSCEYPRIPSNTHRIPFSRAPEYPLNTPTVTMPTYLKICILGVLGRIYSSMLHVISTFQLVCCYGFFRAGLGTRRANEGDCCRMKLLHVSIEGVMRARSGTGCATVWKEFTGIHGHVLRHSHQGVTYTERDTHMHGYGGWMYTHTVIVLDKGHVRTQKGIHMDISNVIYFYKCAANVTVKKQLGPDLPIRAEFFFTAIIAAFVGFTYITGMHLPALECSRSRCPQFFNFPRGAASRP